MEREEGEGVDTMRADPPSLLPSSVTQRVKLLAQQGQNEGNNKEMGAMMNVIRMFQKANDWT